MCCLLTPANTLKKASANPVCCWNTLKRSFPPINTVRRRYAISTAKPEAKIDLSEVNTELVALEKKIAAAEKKHNEYLKELGLPPLA